VRRFAIVAAVWYAVFGALSLAGAAGFFAWAMRRGAVGPGCPRGLAIANAALPSLALAAARVFFAVAPASPRPYRCSTS